MRQSRRKRSNLGRCRARSRELPSPALEGQSKSKSLCQSLQISLQTPTIDLGRRVHRLNIYRSFGRPYEVDIGEESCVKVVRNEKSSAAVEFIGPRLLSEGRKKRSS